MHRICTFPALTGSLALLAALTVGNVHAQTVSTYRLTPSMGTFTPLTGGTAVPTILADDAVSGSLPIGFGFPFGGASYTNFQVSSNGLLGLGGSLSTVGAELSNTLTSSQLSGGSLPALAPFWTDLGGYAGTGASAQYALTGLSPNRVLTMEWLDYKDLNGDANQYISFQVKLYETTGRIEYVYRKGLPGEAGDATIGLKASDGSFVSLNDVSSTPTTSSTSSYNRLNRPATGQVYTFAPATPLASSSAQATAEVLVYPNPAHASFAVTVPPLTGTANMQAGLLNSLGQTVRSQTIALSTAGTQFTFATTNLAAGVYTLCLQSKTTVLRKRVVVQ